MRILLLLLSLSYLSGSEIEDALVKIYTMSSGPDYYSPWALMNPRQGTGSGVIISGNQILTNGHVVQHASYIQVKRNGIARRVRARLVHAIHDADLAILTVDEPQFFADITPVEFGSLPASQAEVKVYGFPIGGNSLSVTKGVVSRVENVRYTHSGINLLAGQIDAAINPGNSGGPVIQDGKLVGVVMQGRRYADNIGYMVPVNVIKHVFDDLKDGTYHGFPSLGAQTQSIENPAMKKSFKMNPEQSGRLITHIVPGSNADGPLQTSDIILSIDGEVVADDGTIAFRGFERTTMHYLIAKRQIGEALQLKVLRDGQEMDVAVPLSDSVHDNKLVPLIDYQAKPQYYTYGGLVFVRLTSNLVRRFGNAWQSRAPRELINHLHQNEPQDDIDEVVIILRVLPADVNVGYHGTANWVVSSVDGKPIRNLKELVQIVEKASDPFIDFTSTRGSTIVLDRERALNENQAILRRYKIAQDRYLED